jgi:hypothetical protein
MCFDQEAGGKESLTIYSRFVIVSQGRSIEYSGSPKSFEASADLTSINSNGSNTNLGATLKYNNVGGYSSSSFFFESKKF